MKHTKGPWKAENEFEGEWGSLDIYGKEGECVATIRHGVIGGEKQMKANAYLIAAAPDLLKALKACAKQWGIWADYATQTALWDKEDEKVFNMMEEAIEKAEGRKVK